MIVKELIERLQMCEPTAIVCYDVTNAIKNGGVDITGAKFEAICGIEDVEFSKDTENKFVYLTEELCTQE